MHPASIHQFRSLALRSLSALLLTLPTSANDQDTAALADDSSSLLTEHRIEQLLKLPCPEILFDGASGQAKSLIHSP